MTGSFLFVKPSDPEGKHGTAYSDAESPRYHYDHASWEWLLERALRRMLLPWALTKSHSREILYGHEDKYSMHRWGSYGESNTADRTPGVYQNVGGPGSSNRETDADISSDDRWAMLPDLWRSSGRVPPWFTEQTKIKYGVADLEEAIAKLPFSLEWLYPGWSTADLKAWELTAKTTETTQGSHSTSTGWTWNTSVGHVPYSIPREAPFKCLSHMRTDDPTVKVNITNDNNEEIEAELAPTPMSAPRTTDGGSIIKYYEKEVRDATSGAALGAGWALSEFYIPYTHGLDYTPSIGSSAYGRESIRNIGCLVNIPGKDSGNIRIQGDGFFHEVSWNGKPTWWHANEFPKGLNSVISAKLRTQLKALCPVCQPSLPPTVPAFWSKFPDPGAVSWKHDWAEMRDPAYKMRPPTWMRQFALACTPTDISARLDAMTTTVHRVNPDKLFAKIKIELTRNHTKRTDRSYGSDSEDTHDWELNAWHTEITVEGTTSRGPFPRLPDFNYRGETVFAAYDGPVSGQKSTDIFRFQTTSTSPSTSEYDNYERQTVEDEGFKSTSEFLVCLRSTANTTPSTKITVKDSYHDEDSYHEGSSDIEYERSYGSLPESYDPDPDDLLFPDWVLPWIESAKLFASIESRLLYKNGPSYTTVESSYTPKYGDRTYTFEGHGDGARTHKTHRKIVSLGSMNTTTGRFSEVDAAAILLDVDPDAPAPRGDNQDDNRQTVENEDSEGNKTVETTRVVKTSAYGTRSRSISYYVVVKWKFDRTDPESLETESPLADLYRKLADAEKALSDKERELSDAQSALSKAENDLESAETALEYAQGRLEDPEGAEPGLLEEAQAALYSADEALTEAQEEKTSAQAECDRAEERMKSAEERLQSAQAAYDAAVEAGEGIEEAQAALEMAYTVYNKAVGDYGEAYEKLENAEANESIAQADYDAAQEYYDTLHDRIEEILQKAVDNAQAAVDDANSRIEEWTEKVGELKKEIPDLEDAVKAAKQAIRDAGGKVD